ncbi:HDOD domain-containing protein [Ramlibacter sp. MAHUQ-53]|uniref:HDOD domain-containing protein n=1 Tax=unclassified Ramlibacter TaxID=2617605 RepID=UPI003641F4D8
MHAAPAATTDRWADRLAGRPAPVLAATREALEAWRARPDRVDANALADVVLRDPLMTLRLLALVSQRLGPRLSRPVETVTAGLVLLGIEPFFHALDGPPPLETLEERLDGNPTALAGALDLVQRAHRAARLAAAFAVHRQDEDAEVLHQAALLTQFGGLLLWCEAPQEAAAIAARLAQDPQMRQTQAQRAELGVELAVIEHRLLQAWGLPPSLRAHLLPTGLAAPGEQCVALAVRIARHLERGWDNPALAEDFAQLGTLLHLPAPAAAALVREVEG